MLPINVKIIVPIVIVVVVIVALVALFLLRPGGLGTGTTQPGGGQGGSGTGTGTTQTETTPTTGTGGTTRAGLKIEEDIPGFDRKNESGVLIVEIKNIKLSGYGKLFGNATVTISAGGISRSFNITYSNTPINVQGIRYIPLITVRIHDVSFAEKVMQDFRGLTITLYYEDPETGGYKTVSAVWGRDALLGTEETTTPIRTRPGGPEPQ